MDGVAKTNGDKGMWTEEKRNRSFDSGKAATESESAVR